MDKKKKRKWFLRNNNQGTILEDLAGFKEMFRMGYADFEKILSSIVVLISPQEIIFKVYFFIQFLKQKHSNYDVKRSNRDSFDCFFFTCLMK